MIIKNYYRLEELEPKFGISQSDIRYYVEQGRLALAVFLPIQRYVFGGWEAGKFVGVGVGDYQGIARLSLADSMAVYVNESIQVSAVSVPNTGGISHWSGEYPFSVTTPNDVMHKWLVVSDLKRITWPFIAAKPFPKEIDSGWAVVKSLLDTVSEQALTANNMMSNPADKPTSDKREQFGEFVKNKPQRVLKHIGITLGLKDACVLHADLNALELVKDPRPERSSIVTEATDDDKSVRRTQFAELLISVLQKYPSAKAKDIWKILESECVLSEGEREFDHHNILVDVSAEEVAWKSRYTGETSYTKFTSFNNTVSAARKALGLRKK